MSIGLISVIIASAALMVLAVLSFINAQHDRMQLWYILLASFFSGVLLIVGINSQMFSIMVWPLIILIHVVTKVVQIGRKLHR